MNVGAFCPNDEGRLQTEPDGRHRPGPVRRRLGEARPDRPDRHEQPRLDGHRQEDAGGHRRRQPRPPTPDKAPERIVELLRQRGVDYVSFDDWTRLDEDEVRLGEAQDKVREKYTDVESMMAAVNRLR